MIGEKVFYLRSIYYKVYEIQEQLKLRELNCTQTYADALRFAAEIEDRRQNK
ncbi:hypothetical protein [Clostridium lundense]|uniref:hypothetical protein n=1 Tax=Clostridium lundense TaxID=319475 RepID=UPI000AE76439|nr:hypothetical protein [Clostridium lundense]